MVNPKDKQNKEPANFNAPRVAHRERYGTRTVSIVPLAAGTGMALTPEEVIDLEHLLPVYRERHRKLLELEGRLLRAISADNTEEKRRAHAAINMANSRIKEFLRTNPMGELFDGVETLRDFVIVLQRRLESIVRKQNGASDTTRVVL